VEHADAPNTGIVEGPGGLGGGAETGIECSAGEGLLKESLTGWGEEAAVPPIGLAFLAKESHEEAEFEEVESRGVAHDREKLVGRRKVAL
jgi:hypothetical protein